MTDLNPYQPPEADLGMRRPPGRYRPLLAVARILVGLWGLFILAGPSRTGHGSSLDRGQVVAKGLGALLFLGAVFPIRKSSVKKVGMGEETAEDL